MRLSLKTRLTGSFVAVIVGCITIATAVGVRMIGNNIVRQAQDKVRLDLNSARFICQGALGNVQDSVRHTANRYIVSEAFQKGFGDDFASEFERIRTSEELDVLVMVDDRGNVLLRAGNSPISGDSVTESRIVNRAIEQEGLVSSIEIVSVETLKKEGNGLSERAYVKLVDTPRARPTQQRDEASGMMLKSAAPVRARDGRILGFLYGGVLVNRNYALVDMIRETVYQGETYNGKEEGTATIFLGDVRISTNVMTADGKRAIGTRVSSEVYERVLVEGESWIERAFVVNDWYITAYEPIRDLSGEVVGILYVGMLEQRFADIKKNAMLVFLTIMLLGVFLSAGFGLVITRSIVGPVGILMKAAAEFASGNLGHRVAVNDSIVEMSELGTTFNAMADSIQERDEELTRRAREEIGKAGRLALIGRLAAGVAHEINNPLGGILLFSSLLLKTAPAEGRERENLERIKNEAERAKGIVKGLLDFARQTEKNLESADILEPLGRAMSLLENQTLFQNVNIRKQYASGLPKVLIDRSQIQQVFINIMVNAAEAMNGNGSLTVSTGKGPGDSVEISFRDTGSGIPVEALEHLFEPFFTTKEVGKGTGLGLSISYGIVESHGGSMRVAETNEHGTEFVLTLPSARCE